MSASVLPFDRPRKLAELEEIVQRGQRAYADVGRALKEILDEHETAWKTYGTFDDYCKARFGIVRRHVDRLIAASAAVDNLGPMGPKLPTSERVARQLAPLSPPQQREVWAKAIESHEKPTAANVRKISEEMGYTKPKVQHIEQDADRFFFRKGDPVAMARTIASAISHAELAQLAEAIAAIITKRKENGTWKA